MRDAHTENWLQLIHNPMTWACSIGHEDPLKFTFESGDKLLKHISDSHREQFKATGYKMKRNFAERSQIPVRRSSDICPLCQIHVEELPEEHIKGAEETLRTSPSADMDLSGRAEKLSRHIAAHLKMLAFRSLRYILAEFDEDTDAKDSGRASKGREQGDVSDTDSMLDDISLSSYDIPPDNRIVMTAWKDSGTMEDSIVQEHEGEYHRRVDYLKLEPTSRDAPEWYFVEQQSDQIDPILEHFRSHQHSLDADSESEASETTPSGEFDDGRWSPREEDRSGRPETALRVAIIPSSTKPDDEEQEVGKTDAFATRAPQESRYTISKAPILVSQSRLCLLSLDGGGVRGLSTLYILKGIMNHLCESTGLLTIKPCEVFDLIGGINTGG